MIPSPNPAHKRTTRLSTVGLYALVVAGALLNMLRLFQTVLQIVTICSMTAFGIAALISTYRLTLKSVLAVVAVLVLILLCEASGVNLGFPFGDYAYSSVLGPKVWDVPMVIPFIWLAILVPSWVVAERILRFKHVVVASIVVTAFDAVMEFAADSLDLWHWKDGSPTELNYISWFCLSYVALSILRKYASEKETSPIVPHLLFSQLLYFFLTDVAMHFVFPLL